jgi:hypothetical protein
LCFPEPEFLRLLKFAHALFDRDLEFWPDIEAAALVVQRIAAKRAGHAMPTTSAKFGARYGDDLDTLLAQQGVGVGVAVVRKNHAW